MYRRKAFRLQNKDKFKVSLLLNRFVIEVLYLDISSSLVGPYIYNKSSYNWYMYISKCLGHTLMFSRTIGYMKPRKLAAGRLGATVWAPDV